VFRVGVGWSGIVCDANFNNRVEEAVGSAQDLHTAYRERAFGVAPCPWLGYLMLLEDCPASRSVVRISEPFFCVFDEFNDTSYARRYELLGEKLVLERLYNRSCLILSGRDGGADGAYREPNPSLTFAAFIKSLIAHCGGGQSMTDAPKSYESLSVEERFREAEKARRNDRGRRISVLLSSVTPASWSGSMTRAVIWW
jgi:hypothetical protein